MADLKPLGLSLGTKPKIVVVDDDPVIGKFIVKLLSNKRYDITSFTSGKKALEYLRDNPVNLMLVDMCMPEMSGLDVIKAIKKTKSDLPIIAMTGSPHSEMKEMIDEMSKLGISNYLKKPFDPNYLEQVIAQNL